MLSFVFLFIDHIPAQDTSTIPGDKKTDSGKFVLKTSDGKTVTIGTPISKKPLSGMDKKNCFLKHSMTDTPFGAG
jgi:hypothetical protein